MERTESVEGCFTRFIEDYKPNDGTPDYTDRIYMMPVKNQNSFVIDFSHLYAFDAELGDTIYKDPETYSSLLSSVVRSKLRTCNPIYSESLDWVHIRFHNLPTETPMRRVPDHISSLIMVSGVIVRAAPSYNLIISASFRCRICGELNKIEQSGQTLMKPQKCVACDNRKSFEIVPRSSEWLLSQTLTLQECPEDMPEGEIPRTLKLELKDDLVDTVRPGERATITGRLNMLPMYGRGGQLRTFDHKMDVSYVEVEGAEDVLLELSEEDMAELREIASRGNVRQTLIDSIAPSIYGYEYTKEAILYLLVGGVPRERDDVRIKGDINVLLVGDPGTAKSQMLNYAARVAPRAVLTTGGGSTKAGLTAAVVKEGGTGGYVLEAGALVLADKGVCCIDELDKMKDEDRAGIHPAMAQQIVLINKGGINATMNARCSILAAANPVLGRYNPYQTLGKNLALPYTLLSRFDLIFVLRDRPDNTLDSKIAKHILNIALDNSVASPPLDMATMKKYISYAKTITPHLTQAVVDHLHDYYVRMRNASVEGGEASAIAITARQLEALIRLAEASARAHLREEVTVEDAEAVIKLTTKMMEQVGIDVTTGQIDIDILYTGKPRSLQNQLQKVLQIINDMERIAGSVKESDLYDTLSTDYGINRSEGTRLISVLVKDGTIYMPRPGYYRVTN